ncbi:NEW3 domain-containing protein [Arenibacter sp. ARW7G5Y1]|uniref:NEW3 domain-containing protein n=1 Tax=Arenibacter sp. ARW7G5Y1 TaxID=2135619 RepID=UPI000D761DF5|nr:NEW3 domain-containing protein [Arenibacter sp. ARW7G5Y1]PXX31247.1 alpha-galactosidase-like protein [Arenibacter sp. ARW7G5Y1]
MKSNNPYLKSVFFLFALLFFYSQGAVAGNGIILYTPYTHITVPPGESIDYSIEVKNYGGQLKDVEIDVAGLPDGWDSTLMAGGYSIKRIAVLPGEKKTVSLTLNVPLKVEKGKYNIRLVAKNYDVLPIVVNVSEEGSFKTEFSSDQINMEGHSKSNFNFSTKLKNHTGEKQLYSLLALPPRGWNVAFKPNGRQATAVEIEAGKTTNITVDVQPSPQVKSGSFKIPVKATNKYSTAELELEVVIKGSYDLELTTPTGLLSTNITAGREKKLELLLRNTGSSELRNVNFSSSKPKDWEISIEPDTVPVIEAGASTKVQAIIKSADKAIPGDYLPKITAKTPEASSTASIRIQVKTPLLWGWLGILIILGTLGGIYYLFRKYGRR